MLEPSSDLCLQAVALFWIRSFLEEVADRSMGARRVHWMFDLHESDAANREAIPMQEHGDHRTRSSGTSVPPFASLKDDRHRPEDAHPGESWTPRDGLICRQFSGPSWWHLSGQWVRLLRSRQRAARVLDERKVAPRKVDWSSHQKRWPH